VALRSLHHPPAAHSCLALHDALPIFGFSFVLPSAHNTTPVQAASRGFGAIFLDVETPNTTSIEYFNGTTSLGKFFVPVGASAQRSEEHTSELQSRENVVCRLLLEIEK